MLVVAGCGGGGDDRANFAAKADRAFAEETALVAASAKLTAADEALRRKADAICERANLLYRAGISKRLQNIILNREEGKVSIYEGMVDRVVAPVRGGEIEELRKLKGTPRGEHALERMGGQIQKVIDQAEAHPWAFRAGPVPAALVAETLGAELGFENCGSRG